MFITRKRCVGIHTSKGFVLSSKAAFLPGLMEEHQRDTRGRQDKEQ